MYVSLIFLFKEDWQNLGGRTHIRHLLWLIHSYPFSQNCNTWLSAALGGQTGIQKKERKTSKEEAIRSKWVLWWRKKSQKGYCFIYVFLFWFLLVTTFVKTFSVCIIIQTYIVWTVLLHILSSHILHELFYFIYYLAIYCMNCSTSYIAMNVHFSIIKPKPNKSVATSKLIKSWELIGKWQDLEVSF